MFDGWSQWTWVAIAWGQVVIAYVGYLVYLDRRRRRILADDRAGRALQAAADEPHAGGRGR